QQVIYPLLAKFLTVLSVLLPSTTFSIEYSDQKKSLHHVFLLSESLAPSPALELLQWRDKFLFNVGFLPDYSNLHLDPLDAYSVLLTHHDSTLPLQTHHP